MMKSGRVLGIFWVVFALLGLVAGQTSTPSSAGDHSALNNSTPAATPSMSLAQPAVDAKTSTAPTESTRRAADPAAQPDTGNSPEPQHGRIIKNVNDVSVIFSVTDKHHHFVPGIQQNDLLLYDQQQLQHIRRFADEANLPLKIALIIDTSSSVRDRFKFEQESAIEFLDSVLKAGRDAAMIVAFDTTPQVVQDFTDDQEKLAAGLRSLRAAGGTALYDAIYSTAHDKLMRGGDTVRKVMVVISDGADNQSRVSREEALEMAQRAGAIIYTIGTEPTGSDNKADKVLERFAEQTGGRYFFPFQASDLGHTFQDIASELRHQYVVSYQPSNFIANGAYHPIDLRIARKGVIIRARKGYYATVQQ